MARIAFIGLGNMGLPMAMNLIDSDHIVSGFDLNQDALNHFKNAGGDTGISIEECVKDADIIITMLPSDQNVLDVYQGDKTVKGVINTISAPTLLIDCSTIAAQTSRTLAKLAHSKQCEFVDAPVSGGTAGAKSGLLTFICGGSDTAFLHAKTVLQLMGKYIFHAGDVGAGQIAKVCNNMLLSVMMIATSESISMGIDNGLDPKVLSDIMKHSSGGNWVLDKYNPCPDVMETSPSSHQYQAGFMTHLMVKDLALAMNTALDNQSFTPLGGLAQNMFIHHMKQGNGLLDFSSIFQLFAQQNND